MFFFLLKNKNLYLGINNVGLDKDRAVLLFDQGRTNRFAWTFPFQYTGMAKIFFVLRVNYLILNWIKYCILIGKRKKKKK